MMASRDHQCDSSTVTSTTAYMYSIINSREFIMIDRRDMHEVVMAVNKHWTMVCVLLVGLEGAFIALPLLKIVGSVYTP